MLAGRPPYTGSSAVAIVANWFTEPVPSARALRPIERGPDLRDQGGQDFGLVVGRYHHGQLRTHVCPSRA